MKQVLIPGTPFTVSRFTFGTARLHHLGPANSQANHLLAASDAGFSHFDTAPLYGFGEAETAFGIAFSKRIDITVTTKVGLYPPGKSYEGRRTMLARKAAGQLIPYLSRSVANWSVIQARTSFEASLRRLHRERVDFLLLHEPDIALIATEEWQRWLENESDRVGAFGIAGRAPHVSPFVKTDHPLAAVVQTRDGLASREADFLRRAGRDFQFTYGYLSDINKNQEAAKLIIAALSRNRTGSIVVSTRNRERLADYADFSQADTI